MRHVKPISKTVHSILEIPVDDGLGLSLPLLILKDGEINMLALAWARDLLIENDRSPQTIHGYIEVLGKLYDFYELAIRPQPLTPDELTDIIKKFFWARRRGNDLLGWEPVLANTAKLEVNAINLFSDWCQANFNHTPLNEAEEVLVENLTYQEQKTFHRQNEIKKSWDLLSHLAPSTDAGKGKVKRRRFNPVDKRRNRKGRTEKSFPPRKVNPLINATKNIRDALYWLLLFYGGVRVSEPLHLFMDDVRIDASGLAEVSFGHPLDGKYRWIDRLGRTRKGTRATYLKEQYGLPPRCNYGRTHPLRSGWKGMMEDDGINRISKVQWLLPEAARDFARLHIQYMKERARLPDLHPYYFANFHPGEDYGTPLKHGNVSKAFDRAMKRVGVAKNENEGAHIHGARHFYGFMCASFLGLSKEITQKAMHHVQMSSTDVYFHKDHASVREEMKKGQERARERMAAHQFPPLLRNINDQVTDGRENAK